MSRRLRVLYLDTEKVWRGGQEQLSTLMTGMQARGHHVALASPPATPLAAFAARAGIDIRGFSQRVEVSPAAFFALRTILSQEAFDVIHSNTPRTILAAGLAASTAPGQLLRIASRRVIFRLRGRLSQLKYNRLLDAVIAVSESIRSVLLDAGLSPELVRTVHEGVDVHQLDSVAAANDLLVGAGPRVGALGALTSEKGHQTLLTAWTRVSARFPDARLVLIGEGPCRPALEEFCRAQGIQDRVTFMGFRDDSVAVLKGLDIFCLPSLSEGFSSALLEAMGCRLPVVTTAVGGNREAVVDGETGILVPPADDQGLALALERLLSDPETRHRMGREGRRRIEGRFTIERKVASTEALYLELLEKRGFG